MEKLMMIRDVIAKRLHALNHRAARFYDSDDVEAYEKLMERCLELRSVLWLFDDDEFLAEMVSIWEEEVGE